jgi:hypothetical protein
MTSVVYFNECYSFRSAKQSLLSYQRSDMKSEVMFMHQSTN